MFSYCSSFRLCMKIEESKASTGGRSVSLPQPLRGISVGGSSEGSPDHGFWTSKNFRRPRMLHLELGPRSLACRSVAVHFFVCKTSPWQWHKALQAQHENEVSTGILARQAIPSVTTWPHDHMTNALHMFFHTLPTKKTNPPRQLMFQFQLIETWDFFRQNSRRYLRGWLFVTTTEHSEWRSYAGPTRWAAPYFWMKLPWCFTNV